MEVFNKRKKPAQQIVEFLLIAPFMVIILGILTEYAYALNINMTLNNGLKTVTTNIYSTIKPGMSDSDILAKVNSDLKDYLDANNVPTKAENNLKAGFFVKDESAVFMASYTYIPAFTLPNVYFKFLPDQFDFFTTAAVPSVFLGQNNYNAGINSSTLDGIWAATASFANEDAFDASKKGVIKDDSSGGREKMLFLVPTSVSDATITNPYVLVDWSGNLKVNGINPYVVNSTDGKLYECSSDGTSCSYVKPFYSYITGGTYRNIIFLHDSYITTGQVPSVVSSNLSTFWLNPSGASDLSATSVNGILKKTLGLVDDNTKSIGNYDNIDVSGYNTGVTAGNTYTAKYFGSIVFLCTTADSIAGITAGQTPQEL